MDNALFRVAFPEFTSTAIYPDSMLTFWGAMGESVTPLDKWGELQVNGVYLFTAHQITMARANVKAAGKATGAGGAVASKSVGSVSVSYDTANSMEANAGHWNRTSYGQQYIRLARLLGAGGVQL